MNLDIRTSHSTATRVSASLLWSVLPLQVGISGWLNAFQLSLRAMLLGPKVLTFTSFCSHALRAVVSYSVSTKARACDSVTKRKGAYACCSQAVPRVVLWPVWSRAGRWPSRCFSGVLQWRSPNPLPHRRPHPLVHRRPVARPPTWLRCRGLSGVVHRPSLHPYRRASRL